MDKTCNLSTVKNTPSEARRSASRAEYYCIKTVHENNYYSIVQYKSIQCIIDIIYNVLEYNNMPALHNAIVFGCYSDGSSKPLFMFKNDVIKHHFTIVKISMDKK